MRDALLIVDMQVGLFADGNKHDDAALVARLNDLSRRIRASGGHVIFVRHTDESGGFKSHTAGWQLLPNLEVHEQDGMLGKSTCDCFAATELASMIPLSATRRLIVTGCATDFCVDTTVRSAAIRGYDVWAPADGHTTADRPHLSARQIIQHHNYIWSDFIGLHGPIKVTSIADV